MYCFSNYRFAIWLLSTLLILTVGVSTGAMTIAKDGVSRVAVVLAPDASKPEQHAAAELVSFLTQVTGGKFEIVEHPKSNASNICVGTGAAKAIDSKFSTNGLGTDGLIIRTVGNNLILAGGAPRGTLYAVYTFLEDYVGCHWWSPQASTIPHKLDLSIGKMNRRFVPTMEYRDIVIMPDTEDPDWSVRNKCVGEMHGHRHLDVMAEHGGCIKAHPCGHDYYWMLPPEKYFDAYPDYYSLIEGKRVGSPSDHSSLCLTNKDMQKAFAERLKEEIRSIPKYYPAKYLAEDVNPFSRLWILGPDDSGYPNRCQCENCRAVEKEEGSPAGLALRFANQMADAIEDEFPGKTIYVGAYHYTQKPPKLTKPRSNMILLYCPIGASFSVPLTDPRNKRWNDDLLGWMKISPKVYLYDYPDNASYEFVPHPNIRTIVQNIKYVAGLGVKGYFGDGRMSSSVGSTEMSELRAWLIAKLLWDPSQDSEKLIKEFTDGYYGSAGKQIRAYLNVMQNAINASGDWLGLSSPVDAKFLSIETLSASWIQLKAAETAVKDDPVLLSRIKVAQLPVRFVFFVRWNELKNLAFCRGIDWPMADSWEDAYKEFKTIAQENGVVLSGQSEALVKKQTAQ